MARLSMRIMRRFWLRFKQTGSRSELVYFLLFSPIGLPTVPLCLLSQVRICFTHVARKSFWISVVRQHFEIRLAALVENMHAEVFTMSVRSNEIESWWVQIDCRLLQCKYIVIDFTIEMKTNDRRTWGLVEWRDYYVKDVGNSHFHVEILI